jgi:hypothetical protein
MFGRNGGDDTSSGRLEEAKCGTDRKERRRAKSRASQAPRLPKRRHAAKREPQKPKTSEHGREARPPEQGNSNKPKPGLIKPVEVASLIASVVAALAASGGSWAAWRQANIASGQLTEMTKQREAGERASADAKGREVAQDERQDRIIDINGDLAEAAKTQAHSTKALAGIGQGQLATAQDTAMRELRPYLSLTGPDPPEPITRDGHVLIVVKNFGRTPATELRIFTGTRTVEGTVGNKVVTLDPEPEKLVDLAPGDSTEVEFLMAEFTDTEFAALQSGRSVLLIRVHVDYKYAGVRHDGTDRTLVLGRSQLKSGNLNLLGDAERKEATH